MSYLSDSFDEQVVNLLKTGAVGFMPSDTVYGLSCSALNERAVEKLHRLKGREQNKPFIVLISNLAQLDDLGVDGAPGAQLIKKYWPGPLTIVLPAVTTPNWLVKNHKTLAVRMPSNQQLRKFIEKAGPLISTSANLSGQPPTSDAGDARAVFGDNLDFYIDVGELPPSAPSTIARPTASGIEVLRQGAVKIEEKGRVNES